MDDATKAALLSAVVTNLVIPMLLIAGAYLMTLVPGPLRAWLASGTHQRDMDLLLGALARKAAEVVTKGGTALPAVEVVHYAETNLPEVVRKLNPSSEALGTMATAAVAEARARLAATR